MIALYTLANAEHVIQWYSICMEQSIYWIRYCNNTLHIADYNITLYSVLPIMYCWCYGYCYIHMSWWGSKSGYCSAIIKIMNECWTKLQVLVDNQFCNWSIVAMHLSVAVCTCSVCLIEFFCQERLWPMSAGVPWNPLHVYSYMQSLKHHVLR